MIEKYTGIEPVKTDSGNNLPDNYQATKHLLNEIAKVLPDLNLSLDNHFEQVSYVQEVKNSTDHAQKLITRMYVAFEFLEKGIIVKIYLQFSPDTPPSLATVIDLIRGSFRKPDTHDAVVEFMSHHPIDPTLRREMLAFDCIDPEKSRVKLYAINENNSFERVVTIITLG
jgi:DMATS type aromatic prenyltransferase